MLLLSPSFNKPGVLAPRRFPQRSPGVLLSRIGHEAIAYDLVTETVHQLSATAGAVLGACDGLSVMEATVGEWADATGAAPEVVARDVDAALSRFEELGLIGRTQPFIAPEAPTGSPGPRGRHLGQTHPVIDHAVAFRSERPELVHAVDAFLGTGNDDVSPTIVFEIEECSSTGDLLLTGSTTRSAATLPDLLHQVTMAMNEYAVKSTDCVTLHAGGVRSPSGEVVVLPAPSGSGKSTLTAALITAGWDYLSDEAIGIRVGSCVAVGYPKPLALSPGSQVSVGLEPSTFEDVTPVELRTDVELLDGNVGVVDRVVLPTFVAGAERAVTTLSPQQALIELLANALNLANVGQSGLDALCDLAERVPVERVTYGSLDDAVAVVEG